MSETHGAIQHVELAPQLWTVVFFPFAAALVAIWFGATLSGSTERERKSTLENIARVSMAGPAASLLVLVYYAYELLARPSTSRYFLVHVGNILRVGQLDANLDFALDPLSATSAIAVTLVGAAAVHLLAAKPKDASWTLLARTNALLAAALGFLLADDLLFALVGWGATGALVAAVTNANGDVARRARRSWTVVARIGDAALVVAACVLFWNLGGTFTEGDYVPDLDARFAAISSAPSSGPTTRVQAGAKASLTLASYPGALVFADDSHVPLANRDLPVRAPFVKQPVDAGMHTFRIHPGAGLDDSIVAHARFAEGAEVALVVVGATTSFREMRDQLALTDDHGAYWRKDAVIARKAVGSMGAVTLACLLLVLAAASRAAAPPFDGLLSDTAESVPSPLSALVVTISLVTSIHLLARVSFLFDLTPAASTVLACVGAVTALVAGAAACASTGSIRSLAHVAAALAGVGFVAIGVGAPIGAVALAVTASLAASAMTLALAPSSRFLPWCAALLAGAPVPGLGASFGGLRAVGGALASDRLVRVPGIVVALPVLAALGLVAFACWRCVYLARKVEQKSAEKPSDKKKAKEKSAEPAKLSSAERLALGMLAVALVVGASAVAGGAHFLTTDVSPFAAWLTPSVPVQAAHESGALDFIVIAIGFGAALAGFAQARARAGRKDGLDLGDTPLGRWESVRSANGNVAARGAAAATARASLVAADTDRYVVDGVMGTAAGLLRSLTRAAEAVKGENRG